MTSEMDPYNKIVHPVETFTGIPPEPIAPVSFSETMLHRDNFFHSCWMRLKQLHPDLYQEMASCELYVAGLSEPEKDDGPDEPNDTIL